jgi:hypothetical protein
MVAYSLIKSGWPYALYLSLLNWMWHWIFVKILGYFFSMKAACWFRFADTCITTLFTLTVRWKKYACGLLKWPLCKPACFSRKANSVIAYIVCCLVFIERKKYPWWRIAVNWLCGIEEQPQKPQLTEEELKALEKLQTSLDEVPYKRLLCDINAVMLITIAAFVWAFFA